MTTKKSIALVGAPNSGKTTLYNWLTGSRFKTVNYPGATVEYSLGHLAAHLGEDIMVMDTPGTYSMHPKSADEIVTLKALYENPQVGTVNGIVVVVDGTQMSRHLLLAEQVFETGFPMIIVVTMSDLLRSQGIEVDFKFLSERYKCPVIAFDGLLAGGLKEIVYAMEKVQTIATPKKPAIWNFTEQEKKLQEMDRIAKEALSHKTDKAQEKLSKITEKTRKLDAFLLHPFFGIFLFIAIMGGLFTSIFWIAAPFMDAIDGGFAWLNGQVSAWGGETLWADFLANGIVSGFGAVLVFVPQIFILFFGIGLLEGSGYLARAATLIDKPFSKLGMSGRSFVPILSGFACAVPAMIATRNISSSRDRWITNFIIPLMTCSARLPVYALLLAFLFKDQPAWKAGVSLAGLYILAVLVGAVVASVVNRLIPEKDRSFFMMELPLYRKPKLRVLLQQSLTRTYSYVKRAGPMIFVFSVLVWTATTFPHHEIKDAHERLEQSYAGKVGQVIEPVFTPMGVDWRVGVSLMSAFAAREVFVSTMSVIFNITSEDEEAAQSSLLNEMSTATRASDGKKIFTVGSVVGLLVFFMIALQCMSTFAVSQRESGSMKFALAQLIAFNLLAYVLAVIINQSLGSVF